MILSRKDLILLSKTYGKVDSKIRVRVAPCSDDYLMKNGIYKQDLLTSQFIPEDIAQEMRRSDVGYRVEGKMGGYEINLIFFVNSMKQQQLEDISRKMLVKGLTFCISSRTPRRRYMFIMYPSTRNKQLPRYGPILETNINSGMTIVNMNPSDASISAVVRKEEMVKVFLHELVHASLVDVHHFGYFSGGLKQLETQIRKELRISQSTPMAIGESATEVLAEQLHLFLECQDSYLSALSRELEFCKLQIMKILKYYGFRRTGEFMTSSSKILDTPTNVFGYMFLRYGLLYIAYDRMWGTESESMFDTAVDFIGLYKEGYEILRGLLMQNLDTSAETSKLSDRKSLRFLSIP